jgi:ComF family protein
MAWIESAWVAPLRTFRGAADALLDWVYPRHCYDCGASMSGGGGRYLCGACAADLAAIRVMAPVCSLCGLPMSGELAPGTLCVACRAERRSIDAARAFVGYLRPATSLIRHFKFRGAWFLGPRIMEAMFGRGWAPDGLAEPELVLPIPLHPRRRRERGYDQAALLARVVARQADRPLRRDVLVRTRYTSQQSRLHMRRRWDNVRGAFTVRKPDVVSGRSVLLVDDVLTTGGTADECAKVLKKAGAARVEVLTLARTAP